MALVGLHGRLLEARTKTLGASRNATEADIIRHEAKAAQTTGYLLAFIILEQSSIFDLVTIGDDLAIPYERRITKISGALDADFNRDYSPYTPIVDLVDRRLTNEHLQFGAKAMFAITSLAVDPVRSKVYLDESRESAGGVRAVPSLGINRQRKRAAQATGIPYVR